MMIAILLVDQSFQAESKGDERNDNTVDVKEEVVDAWGVPCKAVKKFFRCASNMPLCCIGKRFFFHFFQAPGFLREHRCDFVFSSTVKIIA